MSCPNPTIDSNSTGLRIAIEPCLKQLPVAAGPTAATGTITMTDTGVDGDTVTVAGNVFTLVDDTPGVGEVDIGATAADTATALAAAINALATVNAAAVGAVITVTAATAGAAGNAIAIEEDTTATLSGATLTGGADEVLGPIWRAHEPNSYSDFGASITTVARNPINPNRQRRKGAVTDLEASGGFNQDVTGNNTAWLMQGVLMAKAREYASTMPVAYGSVPREVTGVGTGYEFDNADALFAMPTGANPLVLATGFVGTGNNGLKLATAVTAGQVTVAGLSAEAAPPATAAVQLVGAQYPASDLSITVSGALVRLSTVGGDFSAFLPGEWLFVGGDSAGTQFTNNLGFARIGSVDPDGYYIDFDKVTWTPMDESGTGKTVRLFFGTIVRNEPDPALIKKYSYQLERYLGSDKDGPMSEHVIGAMVNEFSLNVAQADKVTADFTFVACDAVGRTGAQGLLPGERPMLRAMDAFNTSSDFRRIRMGITDDNGVPTSATSLFTYLTDMTATVNNNASAVKAVGHLGAIGMTLGTLEVGGEVTGYFTTMQSVQAVRNNENVTLDFIMVKNNLGMLFDIPLLTLGNGRLNVEQDQPITLPLELNAAESAFGYTALYMLFPYLPDIAG